MHKGNVYRGKGLLEQYQPRTFNTNSTTDEGITETSSVVTEIKCFKKLLDQKFDIDEISLSRLSTMNIFRPCISSLIPCRMPNKMEPDPRSGGSQHVCSLFVSSSLP